ncbi:MAG TPA: response regulator transcription factor [Aggregatilineales bacterium]|nr:response regulator transcription factor [Anaerolineae bacterium]HUN10610.1 response regulator transcription factor [Aggregatilineales bacterium]
MEKILIIEDELVLAKHLAEKLRDEGYESLTATNGEEGLEKVRTQLPDLVVLDIMLPGIDGLSLCRMIQRDPDLMHIPIIMLTARGMEVDKIVGLESGADDYIVKPVALGEFLARVRAVLRRRTKQPAASDELVSRDLQVNLIGRRVHLSGEEKQLTNKEFDLLVELMRNKGVVLSRDLILTKVWGYDVFVDKRTVDVHIRWLREKIEVNSSEPERIVTVRGVGYRFEG